MQARLDVLAEPTAEDRAAILAPLADYNRRHGPPTVPQPLAIALKDDDGATIGGLWGRSAFDWLFVELLSVPEALRGAAWGTRLLDEAERVARTRGCVGVWLDTFSFQARGFYEKRGYSVFATLDGHPKGGARHFLQKRF